MIGQGTRWSCLCLACVWPVSVSGAAHASFSATQRGADGKEKHRSQGMRCSAECGTVPHMHFQYCTENDVAGRGEEGGDRASEERVASRQVERLLIITGLCSGAGRGPSPEDERQPGRRQDRYCTVLYWAAIDSDLCMCQQQQTDDACLQLYSTARYYYTACNTTVPYIIQYSTVLDGNSPLRRACALRTVHACMKKCIRVGLVASCSGLGRSRRKGPRGHPCFCRPSMPSSGARVGRSWTHAQSWGYTALQCITFYVLPGPTM